MIVNSVKISLKTEEKKCLMSLEDNQNLYPHPHPLLFFLTSCQKGLGFSQSFNHSCHLWAVKWLWPLLKGMERKQKQKWTSQGFLPYSPAPKGPVPSLLAEKTCFRPSSCYSQALHTSLSEATLGSYLGVKRRKKKGNRFHTFFLP